MQGSFCVGNQGSIIFKEKVPDKPLISLGVSSEIVMKSCSVKRSAKNAQRRGRDRAAEPVRIFLMVCCSISATDIPSDWSIVAVNIIT